MGVIVMLNNSLFSSKETKWETPLKLFEKIDNEYNFTLDVCALPENAKCKEFFTPEIDGLSQKWRGVVWLNPPYGREQTKWVKKASESECISVCLIPSRTDTKLWQEIIFKKAKAICFLKGRLKFGCSNNAAPFPSALIVFGETPNTTQKEMFNELGILMIINEN